MVDADQGFIQGRGQGLCRIETYTETVGEARTPGDGDEIDRLDTVFAEVGLLDGFLDDRGEVAHVGVVSKFGDDATHGLMQVVLSSEYLGEDPPVGGDHGSTRVVARGLNAEGDQWAGGKSWFGV